MAARSVLSFCAWFLSGILASPASALVIGGSSLAYGEQVDLLAALILSIDSGPLPQVSGSAPAPYSDSNAGLSLNLNAGTITSGTLSVNAASNVDGGPSARSASADATVESLGVGGVLAALLTLTSTTIGSSAEVTGNIGALGASGGAVLEDLAISVLGVPLVIPVDPAPNTVLIDSAGVRIVLNEQSSSGDGVNVRGIEVNAIHVEFTNAALGLGLLNGDIVISHSEAALSAIPEPSVVPLAALAAGVLAAFRRRAWQ